MRPKKALTSVWVLGLPGHDGLYLGLEGLHLASAHQVSQIHHCPLPYLTLAGLDSQACILQCLYLLEVEQEEIEERRVGKECRV